MIHNGAPKTETTFCHTDLSDVPEKIYVELTTRCNLHCNMCVKYAPGSTIAEEDFSLSDFKRLGPSLARAKSLILNGIGEPLLHPQLDQIVDFARKEMTPEAVIGFQSNGFLLNEEKCADLLSAGLSTICLSLDCLDEEVESSKGEHSIEAVSHAIDELNSAQKQTGNPSFQIGLEMVLTRENISDLPRYVYWAAERGVDYVIATHLFLYTPATERLSLFNPNTIEAVQLFNDYSEKAKALGLDLGDYPSIYLKYRKNEKEAATVRLFREMQEEARNKDIFLHLQSLIQHSTGEEEVLERNTEAACEIAERYGIKLILPSNQALAQRHCPSIADKAVFIAANGNVMPCRFLWHSYSCRVLGEDIQVQHYPLGNIHRESLENIWRNPENRTFRREAGEYGYSSCWSCTQGPCANLINENIHLANDCYGSGVPCGHCQWNLGGIRCL